MLMMRLQRVGRKNDPSYRVVVTDKRTGPKSNKHVAIVGSFNPKLNQVQLKAEEIQKWIKNGVQPSPTVHNMLVTEKIIEGEKINVLPKKTPPAVEPEAEAEPAKEEVTEEPVQENEEESATEEVAEEPAKEEDTSEEEPSKEEAEKDTEKTAG